MPGDTSTADNRGDNTSYNTYNNLISQHKAEYRSWLLQNWNIIDYK